MSRKKIAAAVVGSSLLHSAAAFTGSAGAVLRAVPTTHMRTICVAKRSRGLGLRAATDSAEAGEGNAEGSDGAGGYKVDKQFVGDVNGYANPMATGAYVEDGWVDEAPAGGGGGGGLFGLLFGGNKKSANASNLAKKDALNRELDVIEFVDGSSGSLTDAARAGTAVPFGGLNPNQIGAYEKDGQNTEGEKAPWGGYAPMPESAVEFFIKYPERNLTLPAGWFQAKDPASGKDYYYTEDGTTSWDRPKN